MIKNKWSAIGISLVMALLLTLGGIYLFASYGLALFLLTPLFMGLSPVILNGGGSWKRSLSLSLATLFAFALLLMLFAIEGRICLLMAAPLGLAANLGGSALGQVLATRAPKASYVVLLALLFGIPAASFIERGQAPTEVSVTTGIEIRADQDTVWASMLAYPQVAPPEGWLFRTGVAYPTHASTEGTGTGAVRYSYFNTGRFVEPVRVWDPPHQMAFDIAIQPSNIKESSLWSMNAPQLHDYFMAVKGSYRLERTAKGEVRLECTTWYKHNIKPRFYWNAWSNYIVGKVQKVLLGQIKAEAERKMAGHALYPEG